MSSEFQPKNLSITTLECFVAPAELDGRNGINRLKGVRKSIDAENDVEAVKAWILSLRDASSVTIDSYRGAAEKLINWSCFSRGKAMSSLDDVDLQAFVDFLAAPQPALDWICRARERRGSQNWRPFAGPLSLASIRVVISAISSLFKWLGAVGYAAMPSIGGGRVYRNQAPVHAINDNVSAVGISSKISKDAWSWITEVLITCSDIRIRLAIELMYFASLKGQQICKLRFSDCVAPSSDCIAWRFQIESATNFVRYLYAMPPIGESLSELFKIQGIPPRTSLLTGNFLQDNELIFGGKSWLKKCSMAIFIQSADLAEKNGDIKSSNELRKTTGIHLRGALESHVGVDYI